jgi:hypothetical protein
MHRILAFLFISISVSYMVRAQDTLPRFTVAAKGPGKILISWHNRFHNISQINIQRSTDSLKYFTTLLTVPDPALPENGAMDNKATHPNFYYRLFIVMAEGKYIFTTARRPQSSSSATPTIEKEDMDESDAILARSDQRLLFVDPKGRPNVTGPSTIKSGLREIDVQRTVYIKKGDSLVGHIPGNRIRAFRDSLLTRTKDTLVFIDGDSIQIKPFIPKEVYRVSSYVFTGKYGNIQVSLPDAGKRHYAVKFYDDNSKLLFELSSIKAPSLIVDKSNFLHSGWFKFEVYEDGQLKEKNKLFIPRDF